MQQQCLQAHGESSAGECSSQACIATQSLSTTNTAETNQEAQAADIWPGHADLTLICAGTCGLFAPASAAHCFQHPWLPWSLWLCCPFTQCRPQAVCPHQPCSQQPQHEAACDTRSGREAASSTLLQKGIGLRALGQKLAVLVFKVVGAPRKAAGPRCNDKASACSSQACSGKQPCDPPLFCDSCLHPQQSIIWQHR